MAHSQYLVTFRGTGVKPKPRLSDMTRATAPKAVTPSGTVIFTLVQFVSLREMTGGKNDTVFLYKHKSLCLIYLTLSTVSVLT